MSPLTSNVSSADASVAATITSGAAMPGLVPTSKGVRVDMVYGLTPESTTGGCIVQRSFENDLRVTGADVVTHVASTAESASQVCRTLIAVMGKHDGGLSSAASRVLLIDGIALLFMREELESLRNSGAGGAGGRDSQRRCRLVGFVHCPFGEPFYRREPWLQAALPKHVLDTPNGEGLRNEEKRIFGCLDQIVAVGPACRSLLTGAYDVPEASIILLEPTFPTPLPAESNLGAEMDAVETRAVVDCVGGLAIARGRMEKERKALSERSVDDKLVGKAHDSNNALFETECCLTDRSGDTRKDSAEIAPIADGLRGKKLALKFVSVGTLCPRKDQLGLIAGFAATCGAYPCDLGGSVLTLIGGEGGDPAYASAVATAAAACDDGHGRCKVILLDALPHERTLEIVSGSDAFLLNSKSESWAVAPVEAAFYGVPVLSTRVGALSDSLRPGCTIWVGRERKTDEQDTFDLNDDTQQRHDDKGVSSGYGYSCTSRTRDDGRRANGDPAVEHFSCAADVDRHNREEGASLSSLTAAGEQERVRRATVPHAVFCVCASVFVLRGASGGLGALAGLVAAQVLLLVILTPPPSPANIVTIARGFIPPLVVWLKADGNFSQVATADVSAFGALFVMLDMVGGALARRSKTGPTRVGAALDVESDSMAVLFLSLAASRRAWAGGIIAGILRYLFVLATGARDLPPSPIGPAGRLFAKVAALASVAALALSIGTTPGGGDNFEVEVEGAVFQTEGMRASSPSPSSWFSSPSPFLCIAGVAVLCASFSVDFYQIWVFLPREAAAAAKAATAGNVATTTTSSRRKNSKATSVTTLVERVHNAARWLGPVLFVARGGAFEVERPSVGRVFSVGRRSSPRTENETIEDDAYVVVQPADIPIMSGSDT